MNYTDLLYGPNYSAFGVSAVITVSETFGSADITVIDKTAGLAIPGSNELNTVLPACTVQAAELQSQGVPISELDGSIITFNGKVWRIESHRARPSPNGEADGELHLYLIQGE